MKSTAAAVMLLAIALVTAQPCNAHDRAQRATGTSVLDMGSIQLNAATVRRQALAGQWKSAMKQLTCIEKSSANIEACADITDSQRPAMNALKSDVIVLKAAVTMRDADRVASAASAIGADVTNIAASDQRI